jgi:hypothetical protein
MMIPPATAIDFPPAVREELGIVDRWIDPGLASLEDKAFVYFDLAGVNDFASAIGAAIVDKRTCIHIAGQESGHKPETSQNPSYAVQPFYRCGHPSIQSDDHKPWLTPSSSGTD